MLLAITTELEECRRLERRIKHQKVTKKDSDWEKNQCTYCKEDQNELPGGS